jgi:hypothetical protein
VSFIAATKSTLSCHRNSFCSMIWLPLFRFGLVMWCFWQKRVNLFYGNIGISPPHSFIVALFGCISWQFSLHVLISSHSFLCSIPCHLIVFFVWSDVIT